MWAARRRRPRSSSGSRAAAQRGVDLTALVARPITAVGEVLDEVAPVAGAESMSWPRLVTTLARLRLIFPTVRATAVCRPRSAADVLVEESGGAALLVVGQRDRSMLVRRVFGSITHSVINRAACPVAIIRRSAPVRASGRTFHLVGLPFVANRVMGASFRDAVE